MMHSNSIPPGINSVGQLFEQGVALWPERTLLNVLPETADIYAIDSGPISYQKAHQRVEVITTEFKQAGYQRGERVLLLLENRPDFFFYWLALNQLGLSAVPANPDLRERELDYLIRHAEPSLAIVVTSHLSLVQKVAKSVATGLPIIELGEAIPASRLREPVAATDRDALDTEAALLYTSGTTGNAKGCVLSNAYFLLCGHWYAQTGGLCALHTDGERMITPLPVFHMNAMACSFMAMLSVGGSLTCLDRFHPSTWWQSVIDSKASCLHYLGVMPSMLMGAKPGSQDQAHAVRFGFGAGIDPTLHKDFEQRFGFPLVEAWAMTETGCAAVIAANHEPRQVGQSCFGRPHADVEIRVVDDNNQTVPANTPGELLVRRAGSNARFGFFTEYYKDPLATEQAWQDGWFHTGDMVKQDINGDMVFVDRKKNVIRRSGENIAAVEVESVLIQHPLVAAAAVTAVADTMRGDEVFACLQIDSDKLKTAALTGAEFDANLQPESEATVIPATADSRQQIAHTIMNWCLQQLSYYKAPGYIAFVDALPLTSTQKIQRGELTALAERLRNDAATVCTVSLKKRQKT